MRTRLNYLLSFVLILTIVGNLKGQAVDPGTQNLTHSWKFNDGTANDYVGNANGTLKGGAVVADGSLITAAAGQWLEMPADTIAINKYKEVTIEAWFRSVAAGNASFHMLAYFGDTKNTVGVNYYFITPARGDDKSRAAISCGSESTPWSAESGANGPEYDDGLLHHMVSTLSDTNITLYIDGQLQAKTHLASTNSIAAISPVHAYLAKSGYDDDAPWKGEILEFNIYNKVLDSNEVLFLFNKGAATAVDEDKIVTLPKKYSLLQNYPNPFNPSTVIRYQLASSSYVTLKVYDLLGKEVATLVDEFKPAGNYSYQISDFSAQHSTGVYFYTLKAGDFIKSNKMVLVK